MLIFFKQIGSVRIKQKDHFGIGKNTKLWSWLTLRIRCGEKLKSIATKHYRKGQEKALAKTLCKEQLISNNKGNWKFEHSVHQGVHAQIQQWLLAFLLASFMSVAIAKGINTSSPPPPPLWWVFVIKWVEWNIWVLGVGVIFIDKRTS